MFKFTVIAAVLSIATAINVIAMAISWYRAKAQFGFYFAGGVTCHALWTLASALDYAAVSIPLKIFFAKWEYSFYNPAHAFFLLFLLSYAGYAELANNKFLRAALWIGGGTNVLLAWTNDWHGWLWSGFSPGEFGNNTVVFEHGPAYLWALGFGYLLYLSIVLSAWLASRRGSVYLRRQGYILFVAFLLPLLGNLIYQFQPPEFKGMDWTSVSTSVSVILCTWTLYGDKLLDLIPIAREKLIDSLGDGMIVLDMQNRIVDVNQPAARIFASLPKKVIGKNLEEFPALAQSISGYAPEQEIKAEIETGVESKRYFDVLVTPLIEKPTRVVGRLVIFRDMTSRKRLEIELERLATTDFLTGALNRRELIRRAEIELDRARRYGHPTSAIMLDIDYFKDVNDAYGHAAGDSALVALAELLTREVRASDLVARYGGEEFMLLLPETTIVKAHGIAERIRSAIANTPLVTDGQSTRFTVSMGVTSSESVGQDLESLLKEADKLLYQAKQSGRNRIVTSMAGENS